MKVLHICNDFCYTKVHAELYSELDRLGVEQVIYTYPLDAKYSGANRFDALHARFIYSDAHKHFHKYFFHKKIHDIVKDVCLREDMSKIDCIHATTLFSDGGVAYSLHQKFGIPYVVAIRNTDVNEYMSVAFHTWLLGRKVIENAQKLVFISPSIYNHFCQRRFFKSVAKKNEAKTVICPNGINTYWLDHITNEPTANPHEVLYVGRFDTNKNVLRLINAFLALRQELPDLHFTIVGERGEQESEIISKAEAHKDAITYLGPVYDREKLRCIMRQSGVFAMVSIHETFGLVYVEALSQGLPILFTKGQGVDGYFPKDIGVAVNPKSIDDIKNGLRELIMNHENYQGYKKVNFSQFKWEDIAKKYKVIILNTENEIVTTSK